MRSIKAFIITFTIAILAFSGIAYAETMEYGDYTYDDNGNVTISGYSVSKYDFEDFLEYVGATYSVVSIDLGDEIYDIESEAFSSVQGTLEEINIPIGVGYIGYNAFGEVHNVKINYGGNADYWYGIYKENDNEYYGNVEFYADGYASLSGMSINAVPGKIYADVWFNFVEADCVAEFCVYDYNDNGEKEIIETYTKNISEGTYNGNYEFDFE
jgi:hypothetical protein